MSWLFASLLAVGAVHDVARLRIPNSLVVAALITWIFGLASGAWPVSGLALLAGTLVFLSAFLLFHFNLLGGGDVKFAAVAALWVGWANLPHFLVFMALGGGCLALGLMAARLLPYAATRWPILESRAGLPYGVAIALGAVLASPYSPFSLT